MFSELTGNKWKIKFFGSSPIMHTLREFTPNEKDDKMNIGLKGVRTFWFGAHHWRGVPEMLINEIEDGAETPSSMLVTEYSDWSWVPKRQLNQYFTREYYDVFVKVCKTR